MITTIIVLAILASGMITSYFYPIYLPVAMHNAIEEVISAFMVFQGFLPVDTILKCIFFIIYVELFYLFYKLIMGIIGLISGTGKPEIE